MAREFTPAEKMQILADLRAQKRAEDETWLAGLRAAGLLVTTTAADLGTHEKRIGPNGEELVSGICAACGERVEEGEPNVILYHDSQPGGIFHTRCAPTGAAWYGVREVEG